MTEEEFLDEILEDEEKIGVLVLLTPNELSEIYHSEHIDGAFQLAYRKLREAILEQFGSEIENYYDDGLY
jgi:hypothetical protein